MSSTINKKCNNVNHSLSIRTAEFHLYNWPVEFWNFNLNLGNFQLTEYAESLGIMKFNTTNNLLKLRSILEQNNNIPNGFIFLKNVGRTFTTIRRNQENKFNIFQFINETDFSNEIFLLYTKNCKKLISELPRNKVIPETVRGSHSPRFPNINKTSKQDLESSKSTEEYDRQYFYTNIPIQNRAKQHHLPKNRESSSQFLKLSTIREETDANVKKDPNVRGRHVNRFQNINNIDQQDSESSESTEDDDRDFFCTKIPIKKQTKQQPIPKNPIWREIETNVKKQPKVTVYSEESNESLDCEFEMEDPFNNQFVISETLSEDKENQNDVYEKDKQLSDKEETTHRLKDKLNKIHTENVHKNETLNVLNEVSEILTNRDEPGHALIEKLTRMGLSKYIDLIFRENWKDRFHKEKDKSNDLQPIIGSLKQQYSSVKNVKLGPPSKNMDSIINMTQIRNENNALKSRIRKITILLNEEKINRKNIDHVVTHCRTILSNLKAEWPYNVLASNRKLHSRDNR